MAEKKISVKCNFTSVFAQFDTISDIKELANNICAQVKDAYDARLKEIEPDKEEVEVVEAVIETGAEDTKPEKREKSNKAATKMERAKAMAEKFKKQETEKPKAKAGETKTAAQATTKKPSTKTDKGNDDLISITDKAAIKKLGLKFEKYNERCWVLRGDSKPLRKELVKFKGVFNSRLSGGEGWVFRNDNVEECAKALGIKIKTA